MNEECAWKTIVRIEIENINYYKEIGKEYNGITILPKGNECYRCDGMKEGVCNKYLSW